MLCEQELRRGAAQSQELVVGGQNSLPRSPGLEVLEGLMAELSLAKSSPSLSSW